jgi:DNA-binding transcriptional MerR regulator
MATTLRPDADVRVKYLAEMIRIGELARRSGVSVRALRYYEEQGLLVAERSASGQRHYPETAVERVAFFQDMYAAGLNSRNIATLLPCVDSGHTDAEQRRMLHAERDRIHDQCCRLRAALRRLDSIIAETAVHP